MRKHFRYLTFLPFFLIMALGTGLSSRSQATPVDREIDPACLVFCQQQHFECFIGAVRDSDQNRCLAEYRHCIAQCGKH